MYSTWYSTTRSVHRELNIPNVEKPQFLDDKEIKIKFVLASGHQWRGWGSVAWRRTNLSLGVRAWTGETKGDMPPAGPAARGSHRCKTDQHFSNWCGSGECGPDDTMLLLALPACLPVCPSPPPLTPTLGGWRPRETETSEISITFQRTSTRETHNLLSHWVTLTSALCVYWFNHQPK